MSDSAISQVATKIKQEHGHPSILVNNAGTGTAQTILSESESERRRVFEVNCISHFTLVREFLPAMIERDHGHVITIASTGSFYSQAQNVSYASSKAATMAFNEGLGQELRARYDARRIRTSYVSHALNMIVLSVIRSLTISVSSIPTLYAPLLLKL
jgi:short-subunit dehydrogenase